MTDGVFVPAAAETGCDAPPAFLPVRPITHVRLAALTERASRRVIRDADGRIIRIRYVLPRHKAANWVGPGRGRKSTRPGANGVVELTPFEFPSEFSDRLADLVPPPRKHRHRYHGVFALNHKLRRAVTALAKRQRQQATRGHDRWRWKRRSRDGGLL